MAKIGVAIALVCSGPNRHMDDDPPVAGFCLFWLMSQMVNAYISVAQESEHGGEGAGAVV